MKNIFSVFLLLFAAILVYITFTVPELVNYSGFAAGVLKASLCVGLFIAFDKFVLKGIFTIEELKKGNIAYSIFLLAIAILFSVSIATAATQADSVLTADSVSVEYQKNQFPPHLDTLLQYVGETEITRNSSPVIDTMLASVGLSPGNPYCAASISYCLFRAKATYPTIRTGLASNFITKQSISTRKYLRHQYQPNVGDIVIWQKGTTPFGHVGLLKNEVAFNKLQTVEANTSPGNDGSQRDGEGIYIRYRSVIPGNYFRITYFTPVKYKMRVSNG